MTSLKLPKTITTEEYENIIENWNEDSKKRLIEGNMRLAIKIANSFSNTRIDQDDLRSIAFMGLIRAADTFDPRKGVKFTAYMTTVIKNEIRLELRKVVKERVEVSLESVLMSDEMTGDDILLKDTIVGSEFEEEYRQYQIVNEVMRGLLEVNERDRKILMLRMSGYRQEVIADVMNTAQSTISRIVKLFKKEIVRKAG